MNEIELLNITRRIRYHILMMTTTAGSGHPSSSLSAVELMTVLFFTQLRYDLGDPKNPNNDRVIFSKGHASPLFYALYAAAGAITNEEMLKYRTFESVLEGHPTPRFKYTEASTGSLGQGLSIGLGEALALRLMKSPGRVFVLMGDGELAEGSVWEAASMASFKKVDNLFLFVDVNRLGQSDPTMYGHDIDVYAKRFEAFGWHVVTIENGNEIESVVTSLGDALQDEVLRGQPTVFIAKTKKGAGISFIEDQPGWHGKPLSKEEVVKALTELGEVDMSIIGPVEKPNTDVIPGVTRNPSSAVNGSQLGGWDDKLYTKSTATRKAFGNALARLGAIDPSLVVIDGDTKNSTYTEFFGRAYPDRFFELFIAEQNMAGVAVGLSARGYHPVVSSFACFLTRAADQLRMGAYSKANIIVNGSHAGVSIGEDGTSQMGLEDISLFRSIHESTVLYPSDAVATERLVELALAQKGIVYIRTSRPETEILYSTDEKFEIGGSKVFDEKNALVTVVSAGVTLYEALKAQKQLAQEGIAVRVIDCYSIKPIDKKTLLKAAEETKAMIVVEDHYAQGGLGEAVWSVVTPQKRVHLSVNNTPRSGKSAELLAYETIDAAAIVKSVKELL